MSTEPTTPQPNKVSATILHHAITFVLVAGVLAFGVWGYLSYKNGTSFFDYEESGPSPIRAYHIETQKERLRLAGNTFFRIHDNHATSLNELVQEGLLDPRDLQRPDNSVRYTMAIENDEVIISADDLATKSYKTKKTNGVTSKKTAKKKKAPTKRKKKSKKTK